MIKKIYEFGRVLKQKKKMYTKKLRPKRQEKIKLSIDK